MYYAKKSLPIDSINIFSYFFLLNIFDNPNKKSGHPQTTFRTHSGMVPEKDRIQTGIF